MSIRAQQLYNAAASQIAALAVRLADAEAPRLTFQLAVGDCRGVHADERLPRCRSRPVGVLERKLLRTARCT